MPTSDESPWPRTGNAEMDRQHDRLFALLAIACACVGSGTRIVEVASVRPSIATLSTAALAHFAYENDLMLRTRYPDANAHRAEHRVIAGHIASLTEALDAGLSPRWPLELVLTTWQAHHVSGMDQALAQHMLHTERTSGRPTVPPPS